MLKQLFAGLVGILLLAGAGPATKPATDKTEDLNAAVKKAKASIQDAQLAAIEQFRSSPSGKALRADLAAKKAALEAARTEGTAKDRLSASAAFVRAKSALDDAQKSAIDGDDALAASRRDLAAAEQAISAAADEKKQREREEEADRKAHRFDPTNTLAEEQKLEDVTVRRLTTLGERYEGKRVKLVHCTFSDASNDFVDDLPGVTVASNGLQSLIDRRHLEKWIGFSVIDRAGDRFFYCYANKADMGDHINNIKRQGVLNVSGTVVRLHGVEGFGLICDRVDVVPRENIRDSIPAVERRGPDAAEEQQVPAETRRPR